MKRLIRKFRNWRLNRYLKQMQEEDDAADVVVDNLANGGNRIITSTIVSDNILRVHVLHNGIKEKRKASEVTIAFDNDTGTNMTVNGNHTEFFQFSFKGAAERDTLIRSLEVIVKELKENE